MKENLTDYFLSAAEDNQGQICFWNGPQKIEKFSYREMAHGAMQIAAFLHEQGIRNGQRVSIVLPTHPDFYQAFFGAILAGAIPSALYPPIRFGKIEEWKERTTQMFKSIDCQAVLTNSSLHALLGYPCKEAKIPRGCFSVSSILSSGVTPGKTVSADSHDIAFVQFSSGSTGFPKPIALSHKNILEMGKVFVDMFPISRREINCVSWLPVYHDMGLIGTLISTMMAHARLTLIPPEQFLARPKTWLEALTETKGNISVAPNFAYGLCCKRMSESDLDGLDLSEWKFALCGAEPIQAKTLHLFADRFEKAGFDRQAFIPAYGLAEATLAVAISPITEGILETHFDQKKLEEEGIAEPATDGISLVSVGPPVPAVEIEIRNEAGEKLPENRIGQIWVQGPNVMQGYLEDPNSTKKIIVEGWLNTGDRGFIHEKNLYIYGRYKDLIIIRGKNYDPISFEESLDEIKEIRTGCAVAFGETDPDSDTERLVILAELTDKKNHSDIDLPSKIQQIILTKFQLSVSEVVLLEPGTLPRTSSGKKQRQLAKQLWKKSSLIPPEKRLGWIYFREKLKGYIQHKTS